jgi:ribosomal protein S14
VAAAYFQIGDIIMGRPAKFPLPLLTASRRPSQLRCESCFHLGGVVRVGGRLLCGECFRESAVNETAKRSDSMNAAYDRVA